MTKWSPELLRRRGSAAADMGARRQRAMEHREENGRHREVQKLTLKLEEGSLRLGEVEGGRKLARRRRAVAEQDAGIRPSWGFPESDG